MSKRSKPFLQPIKLDLSFGELPPGHLFERRFDPIAVARWPLPDASVAEAYSAYLLNRLHKDRREAWMAELWRVLVPQAKATILVPYWTSVRAIQDSSNEWPPFSEQSFLYFNKAWREQNRLPPINSDFDFVYGYTLDPETSLKSDDVRPFWIKHYTNAVADLQVVLTKRP